MDHALVVSSVTEKVRVRRVVVKEIKEEGYDYMIACEDEEEKPSTGLTGCKTETGVAEDLTYHEKETRNGERKTKTDRKTGFIADETLQTTVKIEVKKEADEEELASPLGGDFPRPSCPPACKKNEEEKRIMTRKVKTCKFFSWTDDEVELLLKVTMEFKTSMAAQSVDWETVQSKYGDILQLFLESYPSPEDARAGGKEFPHTKEEITKAQLTSKLKAIRIKYRHAVDAGRQRGHGRVVLLFFELCKAIWGGSLANRSLPGGIETADISSERSFPATSCSPTELVDGGGSQVPSEQTVVSRRHPLPTLLGSHRRDRMKRKLSANIIAQEELELKRRMVERLDATDREFLGTMNRLATSVEQISSDFRVLVQHMVNSSSSRRPASP